MTNREIVSRQVAETRATLEQLEAIVDRPNVCCTCLYRILQRLSDDTNALTYAIGRTVQAKVKDHTHVSSITPV